ncbi:hypothetical protein [Kitasatospora sp. NPDC047058]|uniref:hypothetical protein n=1 Tax=Kitasatospora sp. NPDC047058 TaxID=3155620 RepID=UPI0033E4F7AD
MIATLLFAPHGQALLFRLTPATLAVSLAGHLVYGGVLGWTLGRLDRRHRVLSGAPAWPRFRNAASAPAGRDGSH